MFTRIVVGWNDTRASHLALSWALRRDWNARIVVVHAAGGDAQPGTPGATQRAGAVIEPFQRYARREIEVRVVDGPAEEVLAAFLEPGTLVVVGAPPRGGAAGSLGARLAGRAAEAGKLAAPADPASRPAVVLEIDGAPERRHGPRGDDAGARSGPSARADGTNGTSDAVAVGVDSTVGADAGRGEHA
ncbi:universal stress protein [Agromyces sp. SYSU T00194]|uniref:universal stress protein n=1 Tax=Agromyces chitinivorans TaxID=3158560 RepID=UPI0033964E89